MLYEELKAWGLGHKIWGLELGQMMQPWLAPADKRFCLSLEERAKIEERVAKWRIAQGWPPAPNSVEEMLSKINLKHSRTAETSESLDEESSAQPDESTEEDATSLDAPAESTESSDSYTQPHTQVSDQEWLLSLIEHPSTGETDAARTNRLRRNETVRRLQLMVGVVDEDPHISGSDSQAQPSFRISLQDRAKIEEQLSAWRTDHDSKVRSQQKPLPANNATGSDDHTPDQIPDQLWVLSLLERRRPGQRNVKRQANRNRRLRQKLADWGVEEDIAMYRSPTGGSWLDGVKPPPNPSFRISGRNRARIEALVRTLRGLPMEFRFEAVPLQANRRDDEHHIQTEGPVPDQTWVLSLLEGPVQGETHGQGRFRQRRNQGLRQQLMVLGLDEDLAMYPATRENFGVTAKPPANPTFSVNLQDRAKIEEQVGAWRAAVESGATDLQWVKTKLIEPGFDDESDEHGVLRRERNEIVTNQLRSWGLDKKMWGLGERHKGAEYRAPVDRLICISSEERGEIEERLAAWRTAQGWPPLAKPRQELADKEPEDEDLNNQDAMVPDQVWVWSLLEPPLSAEVNGKGLLNDRYRRNKALRKQLVLWGIDDELASYQPTGLYKRADWARGFETPSHPTYRLSSEDRSKVEEKIKAWWNDMGFHHLEEGGLLHGHMIKLRWLPRDELTDQQWLFLLLQGTEHASDDRLDEHQQQIKKERIAMKRNQLKIWGLDQKLWGLEDGQEWWYAPADRLFCVSLEERADIEARLTAWRAAQDWAPIMQAVDSSTSHQEQDEEPEDENFNSEFPHQLSDQEWFESLREKSKGNETERQREKRKRRNRRLRAMMVSWGVDRSLFDGLGDPEWFDHARKRYDINPDMRRQLKQKVDAWLIQEDLHRERSLAGRPEQPVENDLESIGSSSPGGRPLAEPKSREELSDQEWLWSISEPRRPNETALQCRKRSTRRAALRSQLQNWGVDETLWGPASGFQKKALFLARDRQSFRIGLNERKVLEEKIDVFLAEKNWSWRGEAKSLSPKEIDVADTDKIRSDEDSLARKGEAPSQIAEEISIPDNVETSSYQDCALSVPKETSILNDPMTSDQEWVMIISEPATPDKTPSQFTDRARRRKQIRQKLWDWGVTDGLWGPETGFRLPVNYLSPARRSYRISPAERKRMEQCLDEWLVKKGWPPRQDPATASIPSRTMVDPASSSATATPAVSEVAQVDDEAVTVGDLEDAQFQPSSFEEVPENLDCLHLSGSPDGEPKLGNGAVNTSPVTASSLSDRAWMLSLLELRKPGEGLRQTRSRMRRNSQTRGQLLAWMSNEATFWGSGQGFDDKALQDPARHTFYINRDARMRLEGMLDAWLAKRGYPPRVHSRSNGDIGVMTSEDLMEHARIGQETGNVEHGEGSMTTTTTEPTTENSLSRSDHLVNTGSTSDISDQKWLMGILAARPGEVIKHCSGAGSLLRRNLPEWGADGEGLRAETGSGPRLKTFWNPAYPTYKISPEKRRRLERWADEWLRRSGEPLRQVSTTGAGPHRSWETRADGEQIKSFDDFLDRLDFLCSDGQLDSANWVAEAVNVAADVQPEPKAVTQLQVARKLEDGDKDNGMEEKKAETQPVNSLEGLIPEQRTITNCETITRSDVGREPADAGEDRDAPGTENQEGLEEVEPPKSATSWSWLKGMAGFK